jgi:hypothetical protein
MKFFKFPLSVWVYVGGAIALGAIGLVINHIRSNKVKSKRKVSKQN